MLLTISTTHRPATELAGLLGQHPDAVRATTFPFGHAMLCFPQADERRCSVAVMLQHPGRPAKASMLAEALADLLAPARDVAGPAMPFEVALPVLACPGGPEQLWALFGPLGYDVITEAVRGGEPDELAIGLCGLVPLAGLVSHLCTTLPVLDGEARPADPDGHGSRPSPTASGISRRCPGAATLGASTGLGGDACRCLR